uniref:glucuronosyltransferase n=1 Tax=Strongyloides venezuelensis TaxID=75913 RepID=A0A0K0FIW0_STRVS
MKPGVKHHGAFKAKVITYPATKEIEDGHSINHYKRSYSRIVPQKNKKEKFDLGIVETFHISIPGKFKAWGIKAYVKRISMSLDDSTYKYFGMPSPGSFIPNHNSPFNNKITYRERFQNMLAHYVEETVFCIIHDKISLQKEFVKKFGVGFFDSKTVVGDSPFLLLNLNLFLDISGTKTPKMVEVLGIGIKDPKPLDDY